MPHCAVYMTVKAARLRRASTEYHLINPKIIPRNETEYTFATNLDYVPQKESSITIYISRPHGLFNYYPRVLVRVCQRE